MTISIVIFLICHMTSGEHMFKGLYEFIGECPSELAQCRIQKKTGDIVYSWGTGRILRHQQNFIDCYCFAQFQPLIFSCIKCAFE